MPVLNTWQQATHQVYGYGSKESAAMSAKLNSGYLRTAGRTIGAEISALGCEPGKIGISDEDTIRQFAGEANKWASGITTSYNNWLSWEIVKVTDVYRTAHGGSLRGMNRNTLAKQLKPSVRNYWRGYRLPNAVDGSRRWHMGQSKLIAITEQTRANAIAFSKFHDKSQTGAEAHVVPGFAVCADCGKLVSMGWVPVKEMFSVDLPLHPRCPHSFESRLPKDKTINCDQLWRGGALPVRPVEIPWGLDPAQYALMPYDPLSDIGVDGWYEVHNMFSRADAHYRALEVKDQIVKALSERTGLSYDQVNSWIRNWSISSGDARYTSMKLQEAAYKEFGLTPNQYFLDRLRLMEERRLARGDVIPLTLEKDMRLFMRAMYNHTQETLAAKGGLSKDVVRLYRGITIQAKEARQLGIIVDSEKVVNIDMISNPMSSWTTSLDMAKTFARDTQENEVGILLYAIVPRERIAGSALTGFGCLSESEVVLMGVRGIDRVIARFFKLGVAAVL